MGVAQFLQGRWQEGGDRDIGDIGEGAFDLFDGVVAAQDLCTHLEAAVAGPATYSIQGILIVAGLLQHGFQLCLQCADIRQARENVALENILQQAGAAAQLIGEGRGCANHLSQQLQQARVLLQHGKKLNASRQTTQELVELGQGPVRLTRLSQSAEQCGHELGEDLPAALGARGAVASMVPGPHQVEDPRPVLKTHTAEGFQGPGFRLTAGEYEIAGPGEGRGLFEELGVVVLHAGQDFDQALAKSLLAVEQQKACNLGNAVRILRQAVRLLVGDHLQTVLKSA